MTADGERSKIDDLRKEDEQRRGQLDAIFMEARQKKGGWTEDEIEYWLHPALHIMLRELGNLSARMANLEDMVLRAMEGAGGSMKEWKPAAYQTGQERQDDQAGVGCLRVEEQLIHGLMDLHRPVTPVDRSNLATELLRMLDRFIGTQNELRELRKEPRLPMRNEWERK